MPEVILWQIIEFFKRIAKYLWAVLMVALLIIPFGIPILLLVTLFKKMRKEK